MTAARSAMIGTFAATSPALVDYRARVLATVPSLIHYWPCDNQTGEFEDQVGAVDLTNSGSSASVDVFPGIQGGSRSFDGNDRLTGAVALQVNMLIGCVFREPNPIVGGGLHGRWLSNNGMMLYTLVGGALVGHFGGANIQGGSIGTGWNFGMFSSGGAGRRLYLNATQVATSGTTSGHGTTGSSAWEIGAYGNAADDYEGKIAHCWVANAQPDDATLLAIAEALSLT